MGRSSGLNGVQVARSSASCTAASRRSGGDDQLGQPPLVVCRVASGELVHVASSRGSPPLDDCQGRTELSQAGFQMCSPYARGLMVVMVRPRFLGSSRVGPRAGGGRGQPRVGAAVAGELLCQWAGRRRRGRWATPTAAGSRSVPAASVRRRRVGPVAGRAGDGTIDVLSNWGAVASAAGRPQRRGSPANGGHARRPARVWRASAEW